MLSRDRAKQILMPLAEDCLLPAVQAGIDLMGTLKPKQARPLTKRSRANILNDYVVDYAVQTATDVPKLFLDTDRGLTAFVVDQSAYVRIKKIDEDGKYSNFPTMQQQDLLYQRELFSVDGILTQVIFGYRLDDLWRSVTQVSFVCWRGQRRCWEIPLADDLQSYLPAIAAEETQVRKPLVRAKSQAKKERKRG